MYYLYVYIVYIIYVYIRYVYFQHINYPFSMQSSIVIRSYMETLSKKDHFLHEFLHTQYLPWIIRYLLFTLRFNIHLHDIYRCMLYLSIYFIYLFRSILHSIISRMLCNKFISNENVSVASFNMIIQTFIIILYICIYT